MSSDHLSEAAHALLGGEAVEDVRQVNRRYGSSEFGLNIKSFKCYIKE